VEGADDAVLDGFTVTGAYAFDGGGIYCDETSPTIRNCVITGNYARLGAGIHNNSCDPNIVNCVIAGNQASEGAAGIYNLFASPAITNCTIYDNDAPEGYGAGVLNVATSSRPKITNCILWNNEGASGAHAEDAQIYGGEPVISHSCIDGWTGDLGGTGNIDDNPCFVDIDYPPGPDDGIYGTADDGLRLDCGSPCLNTADANLAPPRDILGFHRPYPDMGAYEGPTKVVVMCWIDESYWPPDTLTRYYSEPQIFNEHFNEYANLINSSTHYCVKSGCLVPLNSDPYIPPGIEPVLPEDYFYPDPVPPQLDPEDWGAEISIYEFPRTNPTPVLQDFINHFDRIRDGVIPDFLCLSVDNSGSMTTSDIEPHYSQDQGDNFIDWIKDNYPDIIVKEQEFHDQAWVHEMTGQIQNVFDE